MVEEEESEFSHFEDDEEFENYRQVSCQLKWSHKLIYNGPSSKFLMYLISLFIELFERMKMRTTNLNISQDKELVQIAAVQHLLHHLPKQ